MNSSHPQSSLVVPRLDTDIVGSRILVFDELDSTNERALAIGGDGLVVAADRQTAGRGRHGRTWHSMGEKGLWFSVAFEGEQPGAAFAAPLAIRDTLRPLVPISVKWPNDILSQGRKLAGILVERRANTTVLGIGMNVNHSQDDFPDDVRRRATSLALATGRSFDRADVLRDVLHELDKYIGRIRGGQLHAVHREWRDACGIVGKQVRYGDIHGIVTDVDMNGGLTVATGSGKDHVVFGEIIELENL